MSENHIVYDADAMKSIPKKELMDLLRDRDLLDQLIAFNNVAAISNGKLAKWSREYIESLLEKSKE